MNDLETIVKKIRNLESCAHEMLEHLIGVRLYLQEGLPASKTPASDSVVIRKLNAIIAKATGE